jgi:hypothetical protein
MTKPMLDRANPYPDFKDFLLGLKPDLNGMAFKIAERLSEEEILTRDTGRLTALPCIYTAVGWLGAGR